MDIDMRVWEHVNEVLKMTGSKERHTGVITKIQGTTTFVKSGDREFLAWSRPELTVGTSVTFRIDGQRVKDVELLKAA